MKEVFLTIGLLVISINSFAAKLAPAMTSDAIVAATEEFEKNEKASVPKYTGIKGWPNGNNYAVKVFLDGSNTITYSCGMMTMGGSDMMMCDKK